MNYIAETIDLVRRITEVATSEKKKSGFLIGNTGKIDKQGLYFTPMRITNLMVIGGVIIYSEGQAIEVTKMVDGKVDYVLVDAEKKVADKMSVSGEPANIVTNQRHFTKYFTLFKLLQIFFYNLI